MKMLIAVGLWNIIKKQSQNGGLEKSILDPHNRFICSHLIWMKVRIKKSNSLWSH